MDRIKETEKEHNKFLKEQKELDKTAKKNEEVKPKSRAPVIS